jgi:hypothetical protein
MIAGSIDQVQAQDRRPATFPRSSCRRRRFALTTIFASGQNARMTIRRSSFSRGLASPWRPDATRTALALAAAVIEADCSDEPGGESAARQQGTTIQLADGAVQGDVDSGSRRFGGIPFAAPRRAR